MSRSVLLISLILAATIGTADAQNTCNVTQFRSMLGNITGAQRFASIIDTAFNSTELANILQSPNGVTLLIPSDRAAANLEAALQLPPGVTINTLLTIPIIADALKAIIAGHVIPSQFNSTSLYAMAMGVNISTLTPGSMLSFHAHRLNSSASHNMPGMSMPMGTGVAFSTPYSPNVNVTVADLLIPGCSRDTIHVIDSVLLPTSAATLRTAAGAFLLTMTPPTLSPVSSPPPPRASGAATLGVRNLAILALAAIVSALAAAW